MLPSRFLSRHVAGAALSCAVLATPRVTPAQMYAPPSAPVVVSTDWLAKHLNDPNLVLLHVGNRKEYDAGHIPGARYVTLDDISVSSHDPENGLMLEMPKPDSLRARLEALGISSDSRVVVYYGNDWVSPATRVIFTLDYAGLGAGSALLDGGMPAWKAEGRALSTAAPKQSRGQLAALSVKPIIVDAAWVKSRLGSPSRLFTHAASTTIGLTRRAARCPVADFGGSAVIGRCSAFHACIPPSSSAALWPSPA